MASRRRNRLEPRGARIERLPRSWTVRPAPEWHDRLAPVRDGQVLLYYDGPNIQTQWSATGEESLWVRHSDGTLHERWWVVPLDDTALNLVLRHGSYGAAFDARTDRLLVDVRYHPSPTNPAAPHVQTTYEARYQVSQVTDAAPCDTITTTRYVREVAEWAHAMLRWREERQAGAVDVTV